LLGKPERGFSLNRRPGFGQAANDAWNAGWAKFDCASQQDPMAGRDALFFDGGGLETRRKAKLFHLAVSVALNPVNLFQNWAIQKMQKGRRL
jgi:hypothetical protein